MIEQLTVVSEHVRERYGVVSLAELAALGLSPTQRKALIAHSMLIEVHRGVYRMASAPNTLLAQCRAICLAEPAAAITGRAAGKLWDLRRTGRPAPIEVRAAHFSHALSADHVVLRRCNRLDPVDIVERPDGIRVVSPPRLAFDLAADLFELDLESVIEQIIDRGWGTIPTLHDVGRRLWHPARPGSARFAKVLASRPAWLQPADSHLEVSLFDALRSAGVESLVRQHRLPLPGGWAIHGDLAVPPLRWMIPVDHVTWHGGRLDAQRDKQNDRQARALGWQVDRVTDEDLTQRLPATVAELLAIHRTLLASVRSEHPHAS